MSYTIVYSVENVQKCLLLTAFRLLPGADIARALLLQVQDVLCHRAEAAKALELAVNGLQSRLELGCADRAGSEIRAAVCTTNALLRRGRGFEKNGIQCSLVLRVRGYSIATRLLI